LKIRTKISLLITVSAAVMALLMASISYLAFRSTSLENEHERGELVYDLVRSELLLHLLQGEFDHELVEKKIMSSIADLRYIRVVRGPAAEQQFGKGAHSPNEIEQKAILSNGAIDRIVELKGQVLYQYVTPLYADRRCLQCHEVPLKALLGVVNIELDMTAQRLSAMNTAAVLIFALILFSIMLGLALRRMIIPIVNTTTSLHQVVYMAENGDFSGRLKEGRNDELGQIASQTNHLMKTLEQSFGTIIRGVEKLTSIRARSEDGNLLSRTVSAVNSMVDAIYFKQTIEEDRSLDEVYQRLQDVISDKLGIGSYSYYEVDQPRNALRLVFAGGLPPESKLWCKTDITVDATVCRACRTAMEIDSDKESHLCLAFAGNDIQHDQNYLHYCFPLLLAGKLGGVLQVVYSEAEMSKIRPLLDDLRSYLTEAAPVIESKRLTKALHETTLKDPLTGLYNRRFLEQFKDKFVAASKRRQSTMALLMCDLDFFKVTNDTYGHQVGDMVLVTAARVLSEAARISDHVIRYGGEEFLIILDGAIEDKAHEVAERIRGEFEAFSFDSSIGSFAKTLSIGIATYPGDSEDFDKCIAYADKALYRAKQTGRNRVVRYDPDMSQTGQPSEE